MKRISRELWKTMLVMIFCCGFMSSHAYADDKVDLKAIPDWSIMWGDPPGGLEGVIATSSNHWIKVINGESSPKKPKEVSSAWIRLQLPSHIPKDYGIYIEGVYTQNLWVYIGNRLVREIKFDFPIDRQRSLFSISSEDGGEVVYLKLETSTDRLGIHSVIKLDDYARLTRSFALQDLSNIILGCAFLFIAASTLIGSFFLKKSQLTNWALVSVLNLTLGIIFITYSAFLYANFTGYGGLFTALFDVSLAVFLPALSYFFEKIFDDGKYKLIRWFRKFQVVYSIFSITFMLVNQLNAYRFNKAYFLVSVTVLGFIMISQFILMICFSIILVRRGNKEAVIFSSGFTFLAFMSTLDLICFYASSQNYQFFLWKWGVVGFIIVIVVVLGRRFAINQEHMINYSKELEFYNHQLQLSEKMEIISSLAASVAHEVRNPLQVTRGFLQLIAARTDDKNKEYMGIAIEELDRASVIITDFLTFAKPQLDDLVDLNVSKEISQIEGIIVPLATLYGGRITVSVPSDLHIQGNSSKLKQVLINIIKNSIEAFQVDGQIHIWAYHKNDEVYIHIKDNGEGIEPEQLIKLGEPYYSTKSKGTGLGLMVTFRIIEIMKGHIEFKSQRYIGTEVIIRFPSIAVK
ncbi:two-component system sporulation sensor kinase B [Paenibacillus sp. V4I9]|uniref:sensor histidine kinase n=1 Tax=Paenibacillus sp. V4I9 TaxID=3042308 RepID=UPI002783345E|nr:HAMP domain-containing sensor histidine kinase [Paenibacillus sp. V4I9]MDQ0890379.1 two-component system sporulation sensor kinase B [Paenibacillus sp. V4I9]